VIEPLLFSFLFFLCFSPPIAPTPQLSVFKSPLLPPDLYAIGVTDPTTFSSVTSPRTRPLEARPFFPPLIFILMDRSRPLFFFLFRRITSMSFCSMSILIIVFCHFCADFFQSRLSSTPPSHNQVSTSVSFSHPLLPELPWPPFSFSSSNQEPLYSPPRLLRTLPVFSIPLP